MELSGQTCRDRYRRISKKNIRKGIIVILHTCNFIPQVVTTLSQRCDKVVAIWDYNYVGWFKLGVWNDDESDCLKEALEHYRGYDWKGGDCDLPEGVTWEMVANRVGTRTAHQCRSHWLVGREGGSTHVCYVRTMLLSWKCQGGWRKWNVVDDVHLLETLNEAAGDDDIETEDDIDWEKISIGWTKYCYYGKIFFKSGQFL